jgi:hypothetical protein
MTARAFCLFGAGEMNRTPDLLITNELLYRLSYTGEGPHSSKGGPAFSGALAGGAGFAVVLRYALNLVF